MHLASRDWLKSRQVIQMPPSKSSLDTITIIDDPTYLSEPSNVISKPSTDPKKHFRATHDYYCSSLEYLVSTEQENFWQDLQFSMPVEVIIQNCIQTLAFWKKQARNIRRDNLLWWIQERVQQAALGLQCRWMFVCLVSTIFCSLWVPFCSGLVPVLSFAYVQISTWF